MWFKSARIYKIEMPNDLKEIFNNEEKLEECVKKAAFSPCKAQEISTIGFAPVLGKNTNAYSYSDNHHHYFKLIEETKILPASVIQTELEDVIEEKEAELGREIKKSEKAALKTAIVSKLLAQAFAARRELFIFVNSDKGYVAVSAASVKRAEKALALMREAFTSFPAKVFQPRCVVEDKLTSWLSDSEMPQVFTLGSDATLKSLDEGSGTVRISREDLQSDEILGHIKSGKVVTDLQLCFEDAISLVLSYDLSFKRIRPEDQYIETNLDIESIEDEVTQNQSHLILQSAVFDDLITEITRIFDCE